MGINNAFQRLLPILIRSNHRSKKEDVFRKAKRGYYEVVLTSFDTCRINRNEIDDIEWTALFVDEAHRLKGISSFSHCLHVPSKW